MAIEKYLVSIRDYLREKEGWDSEICRVGDSGRPHPTAGDLSVVIHLLDWTPRDLGLELGIDQQFTLQITFTERSTATPIDQWDEDFILNLYGKGLYKVARRVIARLSKDAYVIMQRANALIPDTYDKFIEPFFWIGTDAVPTEQSGAWFWAEPTTERAGLSLGVRFRGGRIKEAHHRVNLIT